MASIVLAGNTSGSITISSPSVSGTNTLTLPANTGTVLTTGSTFAGTGPVFSAYTNSTSSITTSTWTKIPINLEEFDTNNNYDTSNYRFTPTVSGYYQINGQARANGTLSRVLCAIRKNGNEFKLGADLSGERSTIASVIYMNGTTDYLELWIYAVGSGITFTGSVGADNVFGGYLARSA
jgi:hypothetical protein